jgi:hypothetical protein
VTRVLFQADALPVLQNRVYDTVAEAMTCASGNIRLEQDPASGVVSNAAFDPTRIVYDRNYNNEQANSLRFRVHMENVADLVLDTMGRDLLVEVGCGKGTFLEMLLARGVDVTGFDPAYEGFNPRVRALAFAPGLSVQGKGLILRHVLEHIPDPLSFLEEIAQANGGKGLIYIEVPCLEWILERRAWFDIFYEHVNYFRLDDFHRMFGRVLHAGHSFGGQYLTVVADLASLRRPDPALIPEVQFPEGFRHSTAPARVAGGLEVVWGGASKGVIFTLMRARAGAPVDRVIDINPAKQGRFLPLTGLRVSSPEEGLRDLPGGSTIHVMNPNYMAEIRAMAGEAFRYIGASDD